MYSELKQQYPNKSGCYSVSPEYPLSSCWVTYKDAYHESPNCSSLSLPGLSEWGYHWAWFESLLAHTGPVRKEKASIKHCKKYIIKLPFRFLKQYIGGCHQALGGSWSGGLYAIYEGTHCVFEGDIRIFFIRAEHSEPSQTVTKVSCH